LLIGDNRLCKEKRYLLAKTPNIPCLIIASQLFVG
jgi:hypothetical protein